jgi:hypothetical protein
MNRDHGTIDWQFTRTKARQKLGYKLNKITRTKNLGAREPEIRAAAALVIAWQRCRYQLCAA